MSILRRTWVRLDRKHPVRQQYDVRFNDGKMCCTGLHNGGVHTVLNFETPAAISETRLFVLFFSSFAVHVWAYLRLYLVLFNCMNIMYITVPAPSLVSQESAARECRVYSLLRAPASRVGFSFGLNLNVAWRLVFVELRKLRA